MYPNNTPCVHSFILFDNYSCPRKNIIKKINKKKNVSKENKINTFFYKQTINKMTRVRASDTDVQIVPETCDRELTRPKGTIRPSVMSWHKKSSTII